MLSQHPSPATFPLFLNLFSLHSREVLIVNLDAVSHTATGFEAYTPTSPLPMDL